MVPPPRRCSPRGIQKVRVAVVRLAFSLWQGSTNGRGNNVACSLTQMVQHGSTRSHPVQYSNVACSRTQMVQHGPTCTHPVQESLTAETEEGFASYRRPQAQRLGSWCTVAFLKLAHVSSCRQRKGSPRIDAHKPSAWDPGVQLHP